MYLGQFFQDKWMECRRLASKEKMQNKKNHSTGYQSLLKLLLERRTVHQFKPEVIDKELIDQALVSSLHVPNHRSTNPVRYYRVGKETRERLLSVAISLKKEKQSNLEVTPTVLEAIRSQYLYPDTLLVVTQLRSEIPIQQHEDFATLACGLHNISLVLWTQNIGTKWSSGDATRDPRTYEILGIDKAVETIEAFFWIGVPLQIPKTPPKPKLNDVLIELP